MIIFYRLMTTEVNEQHNSPEADTFIFQPVVFQTITYDYIFNALNTIHHTRSDQLYAQSVGK
jgi:hypothetical protein